MSEWRATARANATPERLLEVLTHPEQIRRWSPVEFDLEELDGGRVLGPGARARVSGKLAGVAMGFDVRVHAADADRLELSADGPIALDVRYDLVHGDDGAELSASVSMREARGLTGRVVAKATAALLSAGVLDGATGRIARAAEAHPCAGLA
jgi:hypothetical protein